MPYVNIKITKEKQPVSQEQKLQIIKGVTELLGEVLQKDVSRTVVIIDEIDSDNYGFGGESIRNLRKDKQ